MSAEDLKPNSWSGNHPAAPECEANTRVDFPSTYLGDGMIRDDTGSYAMIRDDT